MLECGCCLLLAVFLIAKQHYITVYIYYTYQQNPKITPNFISIFVVTKKEEKLCNIANPTIKVTQWILGLWKVRSKISDFLLKYIAFDVIIYKTFIKVTFKVFQYHKISFYFNNFWDLVIFQQNLLHKKPTFDLRFLYEDAPPHSKLINTKSLSQLGEFGG